MTLIDMQMPGMPGDELGVKIKQLDGYSKIPMIMLTSVGKRGDSQRLSTLGFNAYLTKPVKRSELLECFSFLLNPKNIDYDNEIITKYRLAENHKNKYKVLLVEDNIVNQDVAVRMLEKLGIRVDCVANGKEAVTACNSINYDLVFMDCLMPEMDGFEATREIRHDEKDEKHTTIVAMTANAMQSYEELCYDAGMDDYLSKPVTRKDLEKMIIKWLHN